MRNILWHPLYAESKKNYTNELICKKAEEHDCQHTLDNRKSKKTPEKNIYFCFLTMLKPFIVWNTTTVKNSERDGKTRPPYLPPEKRIYKSRSNSYNQTWNRLVENAERSMSRLHTVYLTYMQSSVHFSCSVMSDSL